MEPALYQAALNALHVAVVVLDVEGGLVFSNAAGQNLFEGRKADPSFLEMGTPYPRLHQALCGEALDKDAQAKLQGVIRGSLPSYRHSYSCKYGDETRTFTLSVTPISSDLAPRQGGDEFVILLQNVTAEQSVAAAERYRRRLARPYKLHGVTIRLQGSLGIARYPEAAATLLDLLGCADRAMYRAKQSGGGVAVG